ncbi:MAG: HAMP domain-containing sensor histidine kinase [Ginsengibacter sp.]
MIEAAINRIKESEEIQELVVSIAWERRYVINYLQQKKDRELLDSQKIITDSIITHINQSNPRLKDFPKYTFLDRLNTVRNAVINDSAYTVRDAIRYYTAALNRINSLEVPIPLGDLFLDENFNELHSQFVMTKMINLLSTARTDIYNNLQSERTISPNILQSERIISPNFDGSYGVYRMYKTYEKELELTSSPSTLNKYDSISRRVDYAQMISTMDHVFLGSPKAESDFTSEQWWELTSQALQSLRRTQIELYQNSEDKLVSLFDIEKSKQFRTLIFLVISIIFVVIIILYFASAILKSLKSLEYAAYKISKGNTGIKLNEISSGIMENLAKSILQIEKNNLLLANAANEIGKGNFDVKVNPRSDNDLLGNSLRKMKHDLKEFNSQKDKLQKETLQLVQNRDEFFSMASHELKTPVTSLKAYTQLLLMEGNDFVNEDGTNMLKKMDQQINKLVALINDLLDTSRLQYGNMEYPKEVLKLNHLVTEVIQEIKMPNPEHKIIFQKNINGMIHGNPDRLRQVINNLIGNAIKYAPDSNEILIRLDKKEDKIQFSIKDFGYGIREEDRPFIFDRFFRVSENNLNTYPGLGVGLYISNEIIKNHEGRMWLESELQKGSIFFFELPLVNP